LPKNENVVDEYYTKRAYNFQIFLLYIFSGFIN